MPSILSKIIQPEWSFPYNCYEVGHTWSPDCTDAALDIGMIVMREAVKLYTPLYIGSQLLARRTDPAAFLQTALSIARSTLFLSFNGFAVINLFCLCRRLSGKFYFTIFAYFPAFVASYLAINLERESRQSALAVYVTNIATETLYRIAVARGYFKPIPRGEVLIFTASMTILMYLIKQKGYGSDPVSWGLKMIVGREEARHRSRAELARIKAAKEKAKSSGDDGGLLGGQTYLDDDSGPAGETPQKTSAGFQSALESVPGPQEGPTPAKRQPPQMFVNALEFLRHHIPLLRPSQRHESCPHKHIACTEYVLRAFLKPFALGWLGWAGYMSLKRLNFRENITRREPINFGLFLGSFTATYKAVNCLLRWGCDGPRDWHGAVGGLCAGPTMLWSPNTAITLYLMWKCIESMYCIGARKGYIPLVKPTVHAMYALSTAQLFYAAVLEPKHMKPSYMRFLDRMTDHRLHMLNRCILDVFGTHASAGYEDWFPDLVYERTSKRFQETVLIWLI